MRLIIVLAAVLGLAVAVVLGEEQVEDQLTSHADVEVDLDQEGRLDVARLLEGLFDNEDEETDAVEGEVEEGDREGRSKGDEGGEPEDLGRYNSFVDTVLRRINSFARTRNDPMSIGLTGKGGKDGNKGKGGKKAKKGKKGKKDKKKDKKKEGKKNADKGAKKDGKKEKGEKKQNKRGSRHPKDLNLDEVAEVVEHEEQVVEEAVEVRQKREVEHMELEAEEEHEHEVEGEGREARDSDLLDMADEEAVETPRQNKPGGARKNNKANKDAKGKGKGKGKGKSNKKTGKKGGDKKSKKGKNKKTTQKNRTSRASVMGISTLRREGDVKVVSKKGAKEIRTSFVLGPVDLRVARKFGHGKDAVSRDARATSPELKGKMSIIVSADGKARVAKFYIAKPSIVRVEGNLHKATKTGIPNNNFMENSLSRITPVATKRLRAAAREVLSSSQTRTN